MLHYIARKSIVYIEPTVVSYLVARPSGNAKLASWQRTTRQLWYDYADKFEFVVSSLVRDEVEQGNPIAAQRRLEALLHLTVLEMLPEANTLAQKLIDTGAVPQDFGPDAQHIAIATVHGVEYLVSWNHKHIVNVNKLEHIKQVCRETGFRPITICTPAELIEEIQMKEAQEKDLDPILEECYRIKAEYAAKFNSLDELYTHLKAREEKEKQQGVKYVSFFNPAKHTPPEESTDESRKTL